MFKYTSVCLEVPKPKEAQKDASYWIPSFLGDFRREKELKGKEGGFPLAMSRVHLTGESGKRGVKGPAKTVISFLGRTDGIWYGGEGFSLGGKG